VLPLKQLRVPTLQALVEEMLANPRYRDQAQRMQAANQAAGGLGKAADLIEGVSR
jgi:UDP:flavonoid glycosyltransferase YjiC (YdhE family)